MFTIELFRVKQILYEKEHSSNTKRKIVKDRVILLTDIQFLLIEPTEEDKSYGKMIFAGYLRKLNTCYNSLIAQNALSFEWSIDNPINSTNTTNSTKSTNTISNPNTTNKSELIDFYFIFEKGKIYDFLDMTADRINTLQDKFKIFQEDLNKPIYEVNPEQVTNWINGENIDIEKLLELVKYKEELLSTNTKKSMNLIREITTLYQKV